MAFLLLVGVLIACTPYLAAAVLDITRAGRAARRERRAATRPVVKVGGSVYVRQEERW